jgi:hypothetical protein
MKHTERWDYWGRFVSRGETNATYLSCFCTASRNETDFIPDLLGGSSVNPLQYFSKPLEGISKEFSFLFPQALIPVNSGW